MDEKGNMGTENEVARPSPLTAEDSAKIQTVIEYMVNVFGLDATQMERARLCAELAFTLGKSAGMSEEHERAIAAMESIRAIVSR